jgi:hypothetical protein
MNSCLSEPDLASHVRTQNYVYIRICTIRLTVSVYVSNLALALLSLIAIIAPSPCLSAPVDAYFCDGIYSSILRGIASRFQNFASRGEVAPRI